MSVNDHLTRETLLREMGGKNLSYTNFTNFGREGHHLIKTSVQIDFFMEDG